MKLNKALAAAVVLTVPVFAQAIELTQYKDPNSAFDEAYLDFSGTANSGNQDQASYSTYLNGLYNKRDSAERRVWGLAANAYGNASRGPNDGDDTESDSGFGVRAFTDVYFSRLRPKLFYFGAGSFEHQSDAIDDNIGVTAGIGYGRVWNATPLAKALRIQEAMNGRGLLSQDLGDDDLMALADVIAKEDVYRSTEGAGTYKGKWYSDMEAVFSAANALPTGKLTALATVMIDEVLFDEPISARRHGWLVRAGAGFQSSDFSGIADNDPKLTFQLEYAKPHGLKGQLIDTATYEPVFGENTIHSLSNRLSYTYEVSDRIDWINTLDTLVQQADSSESARFISNTATTSFNYHLTNKLDLGLSLAAVDVIDKPNDNRSNDDVGFTANIGLRYRVK